MKPIIIDQNYHSKTLKNTKNEEDQKKSKKPMQKNMIKKNKLQYELIPHAKLRKSR